MNSADKISGAERIKAAFGKNKAIVTYITGGDPDIAVTEQLIKTIAEAGVNILEIGIPFSDPVAEGPTIEAAHMRALGHGITTDHLFEMVKRVRQTVQIPIVFIAYANSIVVYGKEAFFKRCAECGIDGVIVPDIPFEEKHELAAAKQFGIAHISLIAPTSCDRIQIIAKEAEGFLYCVSSLGTTGMRDKITTDLAEMVAEVRKVSDIPCAVGFGISTPEQAKELLSAADGVIIGSAVVDIVGEKGAGSVTAVAEFLGRFV